MKSVIIVCLLSLSMCYAADDKVSKLTTTPEPTKAVPTAAPAGGLTTVNSTSVENGTNPNAAEPEHTTKNETNQVDPNSITTTPKSTVPTTTSSTTTTTITTTPAPKNDSAASNVPSPKPEPEAPKVIQSSRAFDGASFVGGIILTLGLLSVGFIGYKYYKKQSNYQNF